LANEQNLKSFTSDQDREEAAKNGVKGGIESGKTRRLQSALNELLDKDVTIKSVHKLLDQMGIDKKDRRWSKAVTAAMLKKACDGDKQCADWVRDTAGEKPTDRQEVEYGDNTIQAITAGMSLIDKQKAIKELVDDLKPGGSD